jgi:hypothetical protein
MTNKPSDEQYQTQHQLVAGTTCNGCPLAEFTISAPMAAELLAGKVTLENAKADLTNELGKHCLGKMYVSPFNRASPVCGYDETFRPQWESLPEFQQYRP